MIRRENVCPRCVQQRMRRRDIWQMAANVPVFAMPAAARVERERTLKFVLIFNVTILDPVDGRGVQSTHTHALLMLNAFYGVDEAFVTRPRISRATRWRLAA